MNELMNKWINEWMFFNNINNNKFIETYCSPSSSFSKQLFVQLVQITSTITSTTYCQ